MFEIIYATEEGMQDMVIVASSIDEAVEEAFILKSSSDEVICVSKIGGYYEQI